MDSEQQTEASRGQQEGSTAGPSASQEKGGKDEQQTQAPRPLLPHDGPLLAQQNLAQQNVGQYPMSGQDMVVVSDSQGNMHTIPAMEVQQIQQWIGMLNQMPHTQAMHPSSVGLMSSSLAPLSADQSQRHDLPDFRGAAAFQGAPNFQSSLPSFQGNGAFAPLRPAQTSQAAEQMYGGGEAEARHEGRDGGGQPGNFHSLGQGRPWEAVEGHLQAHATGQPDFQQQHAFQQQDQGQGHDPSTNPQGQATGHHANFEHLVEHAAAQHSQAGYGENKDNMEGSMQEQGALLRPTAHKPPQATKSSRYRGVYKRQRGGRWEASIVLDSKNCRLGLHLTELAAAKAYDRVAIKKWGPEEASSKINFPLDQYNIPELDAIDMQDLVAMVRAEWRSKEGKSLTGLPMYDESMGLQRNGQETLEAERVPKRVRMDQAGGGEITVPIRQIAAPEDGGNETQERVPIPRSSLYRGVSTHKQSGKWVAQIKSGGKQVYLGFYNDQVDAARAYDQAVIHMQGEAAETNFPLEHYSERFDQLRTMDFKDLVAALKQHGRGGVPRVPKTDKSKYRGVAPDKSKKWRAQITTSAKTTVYLGLWATEEAAARAYDKANIAKSFRRGEQAKTNFPLSDYEAELEHLRTADYDSLVADLRTEAVASVAADRMSKRAIHPGHILAPIPNIPGARTLEDPNDRARYLSLDGQAQAAFASLGGEGGIHFPEGVVDGSGFHMGSSPLSRFVPPADLQNLLLRAGNVTPGNVRPDMLFRMVNREGQPGEGQAEPHAQQ